MNHVNVLVVDDDANIRELISIFLSGEGYTVIEAENGQEALTLLEENNIQIVVVDVMMPEVDGYELTKEVKKYYDIPILMVTAKGESQDKLKGFDLGVDDYVVKPFDPLEIVARVKALLRRFQLLSDKNIFVGNLTINQIKYEISANDQSITLPLKEFELLLKLASQAGRIFTRNDLIEQIWGLDYEGDERTVDVHIKRVRERLREIKATVEIVTIRGLGYKLEENHA
ncbi:MULTISPECIES: response regulator transcription factor [Bacillaceae]|uniref:Heme response regulator HssR n=1 Tax=Gottfriedia luciferensis TaxID=178774 RepID=A0ABX2ZU64_9BACI|nr:MULTISPECIES: response regulator transcription factor [Bacillaceae]ODG92914.1 DNA-binding response regulator [Gottfriedia luciferensis]PGZ93171.1 DNA-binding response regulator [Bacillus sp. AFS029533]SFD34632.1 DNA-binding response regulator, OmpR family, contains REC and winged-helix (wHTH) domain [Bacillus sp. UNCCL81]